MKSILKKYIKIIFYPISRLYFFIKPINVIVDTPEETLDKLLNSTKSLIRFGDGEIAIIQGKSLSFQSFTPEIQNLINFKELQKYFGILNYLKIEIYFDF